MIGHFNGDTKSGPLTVACVKNGDQFTVSSNEQGPIICGIVLTDPLWSALWMRELLRMLIGRGIAYFAFYGKRCEEAHDLADEARDELMISTDDKVIMTTWHSDESLVDFLGFLSTSAVPSEGYCRMGLLSYLIVEVGDSPNNELVSAVREIFV